MPANPLRDLLNNRKWSHHDLDLCEVIVQHRGSPDGERRIYGWAIDDVGRNGLVVMDTLRPEDPTHYPYHRVLRVVKGSTTLWEKP
jgi:uncharacterized protein (UPF0248 family)